MVGVTSAMQPEPQGSFTAKRKAGLGIDGRSHEREV